MKQKLRYTLLGISFLYFSCNEREKVCPDGFSGINCETEDVCVTQSLQCLNGGVCVNGSCNCPDGFSGVNCQTADINKVQELLNNNYSPFDLYQAGVPLDSLYGKNYEGGLIFYLDTLIGNGYAAAPNDQSTGIQWGCMGTAIFGAQPNYIGSGIENTVDIVQYCSETETAARLCYDLELNGQTDWFLPSIDELHAMYANLHLRGFGEFNGEAYWSSTEASNSENASKLFAWIQYMGDLAFQVTDNKEYNFIYVRAARPFEP